ncbi:MAG: hypothetical protein ACKPKO_14155, partial [Candidatus Fonsibacter sp.]
RSKAGAAVPIQTQPHLMKRAFHESHAKASQFLYDRIILHTQAPRLLGHGRTALLDKVGAHLHGTLLDVADKPAGCTPDFLRCVVL